MSLDLSALVDGFGDLGKELFENLKRRGEALYESAKQYSEEVAEDIAGYWVKIGETMVKQITGELTEEEVNISVKNWKQASKTALKKIEQREAWEAYHSFWSFVDTALAGLASLIGGIGL